MSPAELQAQIEEQYGTVYKFCQATGMAKSSVYWALSGRYPGDPSRVLARVGAVLAGQEPGGPLSPAGVRAVLEQVACSRCSKKEPWRCPACKRLFREQAEAVTAIFADSVSQDNRAES